MEQAIARQSLRERAQYQHKLKITQNITLGFTFLAILLLLIFHTPANWTRRAAHPAVIPGAFALLNLILFDKNWKSQNWPFFIAILLSLVLFLLINAILGPPLRFLFPF